MKMGSTNVHLLPGHRCAIVFIVITSAHMSDRLRYPHRTHFDVKVKVASIVILKTICYLKVVVSTVPVVSYQVRDIQGIGVVSGLFAGLARWIGWDCRALARAPS